MNTLLAAVALWLAGGLGAWLARRRPRRAAVIGASAAMAGAALGGGQRGLGEEERRVG
jgi:hypothetical protein